MHLHGWCLNYCAITDTRAPGVTARAVAERAPPHVWAVARAPLALETPCLPSMASKYICGPPLQAGSPLKKERNRPEVEQKIIHKKGLARRLPQGAPMDPAARRRLLQCRGPRTVPGPPARASRSVSQDGVVDGSSFFVAFVQCIAVYYQ
jgi:hypothetical protein